MAQFVATIKWGSADAELEGLELPAEFSAAKTGGEEALQSLSQYLRCTFVPSNIFSDFGEILDIDDEIEADRVEITATDFSESDLPTIKAVAIFNLDLQDGVDQAAIDAWQEENEYLDSAISFQWDGLDTDEDLSLTNYDELSFTWIDQ